MKHVYITHAVCRRISQHLLMKRPRLHDVLCDLTLWRYRQTLSNFAIVLILPNTQRSEKVKRRKGKRASTVVVVALCRSARRRSIISQRWSTFCAIVVRQQVIVKLFEGLKGRAVPSVGICKILTSNPF